MLLLILIHGFLVSTCFIILPIQLYCRNIVDPSFSATVIEASVYLHKGPINTKPTDCDYVTMSCMFLINICFNRPVADGVPLIHSHPAALTTASGN